METLVSDVALSDLHLWGNVTTRESNLNRSATGWLYFVKIPGSLQAASSPSPPARTSQACLPSLQTHQVVWGTKVSGGKQ